MCKKILKDINKEKFENDFSNNKKDMKNYFKKFG